MFSKGSKKGTIKFSVKPVKTAKKVELAGDFSSWQPVEMKKQKDGSYMATISAGQGSHQYKFLIDGRWEVDPDNSRRAANNFGTLNSIATVE
jgi:1,4-alpha-glucan branching enzyme